MSIAAEANLTSPTPPIVQVKGKEAIMDTVEDVVFGSLAGIAGKYIEYPFDTVKVRLQSQPDHQPLRYTGPVDCFKQGLRNDGVLGLYRGISAPLVGAALETSSLFFWERVARESLFTVGLYSREKALPLSALILTGAMSGACTSLVLTPIELVKCKIQVPATASSDGMVHKSPTPLGVIREVFRHQGIKGFWHGQLGTLIRETGGSGAWFGSKEAVSLLFHKWNNRTSKSQSDTLSLLPLPLWQQAVAGASAGMSYNFLFYPADTIKSRMQTRTTAPGAQPPSFSKEAIGLWKQHGVKGLYRGCGITVARSAPSSAFIFMIFDALKGWSHTTS